MRALLFLCLIAASLFHIRLVAAQEVEGRVYLPKATAPTQAITGRYQLDSASVSEAESPVAVVYLQPAFGKGEKLEGHKTAEMTQKNTRFVPGLLAVETGTTVEFPNLDDAYHNVFSYSKAKRFDLGRYRKGEKPASVLFDKAGVVALHCEIHESMRGTILVLDTPYFEKTNPEGSYHLGPVPPGRYVLTAWVDQDDVRTRTVELKAGESAHIDLPSK
ncbi:MAG TPA: hypothetical protein VGI60_16295 [Chthoniobacterales bacterium]|jgi:plastocyanin